MIELILVRHGETAGNRAKRYIGHTDESLNDTGMQQVAALAHRLRNLSFGAVYSSDLRRAAQTVEGIGHLPVQYDSRLRELDFGIIEGLTYDEAVARHPEIMRTWLDDPNCPPPDGESFVDFVGRVRAFYASLIERHAAQSDDPDESEDRVLIVGHGGSLRVLICLLLHIEPLNQWRFSLARASISRVRYYANAGGFVYSLNEIAHLPDNSSQG